MGAGGSSTRAIYGAQASPSSNGNTYIEYATKGNTAFFGNLSSARAQGDALSNSTRIVFTAGNGPSNVLDYNTITTLGNAADFGDLNYSSRLIGSTGGQTRGIVFGGLNEPESIVNVSKNLVDKLNADHTKGQVEPDDFTRSTQSITFYDSVIVFERGEIHWKQPLEFGKNAPMNYAPNPELQQAAEDFVIRT